MRYSRLLLTSVAVLLYSLSFAQNKSYVRTWDMTSPEQDPNAVISKTLQEAKQTTQYLDGLGRPLQTVVKKGSLETSTGNSADVVSINEYDAVGREAFKYMPFVSVATDGTKDNGLFKTNPLTQQQSFLNSQYGSQGETFFYGKTVFEASPLNRVTKTFAPGNNWVGQEGTTAVTTHTWNYPSGTPHTVSEPLDRSIKNKYSVNTATDDIKIWSVTDVANAFGNYSIDGVYDPGQLYKNITMDEHNKQVIEFVDKEGKMILKKVQLTAAMDAGAGSTASYDGWLCTYYIYDELNRLRAVIQPEGVKILAAAGWNFSQIPPSGGGGATTLLAEQCFRYEFDDRGRMIKKKVPGAGEVYMVYDIRDRLVFSQDAKLRISNQWMTTLYDELNRPVITGMMTYTGSLSGLQTTVNTQTQDPSSPLSTLPVDLVLNNANYTGDPRAIRSITLTEGFYTASSGTFSAEIIAGPGGHNGETYSVDGVVINKNPIPSGATFIALTKTYFDNYEWTDKTYKTNYNVNLDASNNPYPESLPSQENKLIAGLVTVTKVRVIEDPANLATGPWLTTVNFYDVKNRVIQVQADNYTGGEDIAISRYDFSGKIISNYLVHNKPSADELRIKTNFEYDDLGRLLKTWKTINDDANEKRLIADNKYDALGQLVIKKIGTKNGTPAPPPLETLTYEYNIRGWLLGMNKDFLKDQGTARFGYELAYDKKKSVFDDYTANTYAKDQFNGNIGGMIWKSMGDGEKRKYDFDYDAANRILKADFTQHNSGWNVTNGVDFSVGGNAATGGTIRYDNNGNILEMWQQGLKLGGSDWIDKMSYGYKENGASNKLATVTEDPSISATDNGKLGDFKDGSNGANDDYDYDVNGNLILDNNKAISSITYNHLNLPHTITVDTKGTITYVYDATGNKLKKITEDHTVSPYKTTTTLYSGGMIYENDQLQFFNHEEGRVRLQYQNVSSPSTISGFAYDYFIKDHLGNVRMVLTDETKVDQYPMATMENVTDKEDMNDPDNYIPYYSQTDYLDDPAVRVGKPEGYGSDNSAGNSTNDWVVKLRASSGNQKIGPGIVLKVMAGDKFNVLASSWYKRNGAALNPVSLPVGDLVTALTNSVGAVTSTHGGPTISQFQSGNTFNGAATDFLNNRDNEDFDNTRPKAYLNWVLVDEQFQFVESSSGSEQVPVESFFENGTLNVKVYPHSWPDMPVHKSGFLYVYVSSEEQNFDVYFDNLSVTHTRGPVLEETHYYPFGLTMAGISNKALVFGKPENKTKFQGQEFATNEFSDGSGLDMYEFKWRIHDPQVGRFWQQDALSHDYRYNSLYAFSENRVIDGRELEGLEYVSIHHYADGKSKTLLFYKMSDKEINERSGTTSGLYNSASYGYEGKGVVHYYYNSDGLLNSEKTRWDQQQKGGDSDFEFHGLYSGSGSITDRNGNYDFTFQPIDFADAIAKRHDMDYYDKQKFDKPGDVGGIKFLEDVRTVQADRDMVKRIHDYNSIFKDVEGIETPFRTTWSGEMEAAMKGQSILITALAVYKQWKIDHKYGNKDIYKDLRAEFVKDNKATALIIDQIVNR